MSRAALALACGVAATVLTAGCSSSSDQPAWPNAKSSPAAPANANGGALASLRAVDPCGLLDSGTLATVGTPGQGSSQSTAAPGNGLDLCEDTMLDRTGSEMSIMLRLGAEETLGEHSPNATISGLPAVQTTDSNGDCDELVTLQQNPPAGVDVNITDTNDPCTPATGLAKAVIARLHDNPPKRANPRGSLGTLDPCTTLNTATATAALGVKAQDGSLVSLYQCSWSSLEDPEPMLGVTFTLGSDPKPGNSDDTVKPVRVAGINAYQVTRTGSSNSGCGIRWATRKERSGDQIVDVELGTSGKGTGTACDRAMAVAAAVISSLPRN